MVLLIRHAERSEIASFRTHADAMLTEQGKADARALGELLGARLGGFAVWHSPVPRCRETGEELVTGARESGHDARMEGPLEWLGGDFVEGDPDWINERIVEDYEGFMRRWFDGRYSRHEITPLAEAAAVELREALALMERERAIVGVTHDWNLMFLREAHLRLRHEEVGVPAYLDSVAVLRQEGRVALWSLGRQAAADPRG